MDLTAWFLVCKVALLFLLACLVWVIIIAARAEDEPGPGMWG